MKSLRANFFFLFVGLCFIVAFGMGLMLFLQYHSYIKRSYTEVIEHSARAVERLFPQLKDTDRLLAAGEGRDEAYFSMVRQINEITESYGFAYIYYLQRVGDGVRFIIDTDDIDTIDDGTFDEVWLKEYEDPPDEIAEAWTSKTFVITKEPYTDEWGTFISGFMPIVNDSGAVAGVLGLDFDVSYVQGLERRAVIAFGISLLAALVVAGLLSLRVASSITGPINEVAVAANTLSQMRFDIKTSKLRKDEIGVMQKALYAIRDTLRQTMGEINDEQLGKQLNISRNLNQIINRSTEELVTISGGMDVLEGKTREEHESVRETSESVADIINSIEALNRAVESQSESIASSSELIEQMVKGIRDIQATVHEANEITETLGESSRDGKKTLEQLTDNLSRMAERSAALEKANETIANIAAQTNILAMNAAIEAAHAGESGKGFAVVASEIRKLAVSSNRESESISTEIKNMAEAIIGIRKVSGNTVESMNHIFMKLSEMSASFASIKGTIEMQAVNGGRILDALKKIRSMADEVNSGSGSIQRGSTAIDQTIKHLRAVSEEVSSSVSSAQQASRQIAGSFSMAKKIVDGTIIIRPGQNG
jgi:methyl-accepting chemotaxis protein